jgi:hypothetical protein
MNGGKYKNAAEKKAGELATSLDVGSPERLWPDTSDGQKINKLAATVLMRYGQLPIIRAKQADEP